MRLFAAWKGGLAKVNILKMSHLNAEAMLRMERWWSEIQNEPRQS